MTPEERQRARNVLAGLRQCGDAIHEHAAALVSALAMAAALLDRTEAWLDEPDDHKERT